jgi:3-deoxy-D-manno-octulosonic-acid transferase
MIARWLYSLAWHLAVPAVLLRLWWRGRREAGYRQHVAERFGWYANAPALKDGQLIWVHAVSVGETRAAQPLVDALLNAWPDHRILLTHMTATGRATGAALFAGYGGRVIQSYLPYDMVWIVRRFLRAFQPVLGILMETEVWPNLLYACRGAGVPMALVNARLSERSLKRGQRLASLMQPAAQAISLVAAQTEGDAERIRALGVAQVHVVGSVKFDVTVPRAMLAKAAQLRSRMRVERVFLAASTREGEEALLLAAWQAVAPRASLLAIVPRHPQRFDEVAALAREQGFDVVRRSQEATEVDPARSRQTVFLGDSMGEMFAYYGACDLAFIGGSLLPLGGQNLIEAAALGKPVLVGPHTFNFAESTEDAVQSGAAARCADAAAVMEQAVRLLRNASLRASMGSQALEFARRHRGATARTVILLEDLLRKAQRSGKN